jgi:hypothetical protein
MTVAELLKSLDGLGVVLTVDDGVLRYEAPVGALSDELRVAVRERKSEIIAYLSSATCQKNTHSTPPETVQTCKRAAGDDALTRDASPRETFASPFADRLHPSPECKGPPRRTAAELVATLPQAPCPGGCGRETAYGWECLSCRLAEGGGAQ